jgi:murein DD-endopeptidase MepM/ murein hydrolase activator NlpD
MRSVLLKLKLQLVFVCFLCVLWVSVAVPLVTALSPEQQRVIDSGSEYFDVEKQSNALGCKRGGTSLVGSDNAERAWNFFIGKGFTPQQTAGILGNFEHESPGIIPDQEQIGGPAYGIAQWEGGRRQALEQFARDQNRDVASLDLQLDFVMHELNGTEHLAYIEIQKQQTVPGATINWLDYYERAGVRAETERIQNAESFFNEFGSTTPSGTSSAHVTCATNGSGQVIGGFSLPVDRSWYDEHPEWFTKPHHNQNPASDIPVPEGTPIYSVTDGVVILAPVGGNCGEGVIVEAANGVTFMYCHGSDGGTVAGARQGDKVSAGQLIMHSSHTGRVIPPGPTGAHLHLEINVGGTARCPQPLFVGIVEGNPPDPGTLPTQGCTS